jgi:protein-tyrosine kinase
MPDASEHPDLELILRGRPVDPTPMRVQIVATAPPRRESDIPRFVLQALTRHWRLLLALVIGGLLAGTAVYFALTPLYVAHTSIEVVPPTNAESLIERIQARRLMESPAIKLNIQSLPEYTRSNSVLNLLRRAAGLSVTPEVPPQDEFLRALENHTRITKSAQGHIVEIQFEASDPPRATAFLDLLTEEIERDQAEARSENAKQVQDSFAPQIAIARAEMQLAQEELAAYVRSIRTATPEPAPSGDDHPAPRPVSPALRAEQSFRLAYRQQEYDSKRIAYEALVRHAREAEVQTANEGGVRRLAPAQVANSAKSPGVLTCSGWGALAGLLLALPLCMVLEAFKRTVRDPGDVTRFVGLKSLGVIPHASLRKPVPSGRPHSGIIDLNPESESPGGPALFTSGDSGKKKSEVRTAELGESFRQVLASIWIAGQNSKRPRVLLFASPSAREGKTTIVANLGIALAHTRRRVLLIEADLRHPQIHAIFGATSRWGLADLLEEEDPVESYDFEDLVFKTDVPGLYVLPAGKGDLAIAGMRHIDRLTELLLRFRLEFHAVLIDTPAVSDYPDARIVARLSDAAVIVLRANSTSRDQARDLARQFEADGTAVLGAVLNDSTV